MEIVYLDKVNQYIDDCVIALGFFDGMHLGHCQLLEKCESVADDKNLKKALMTFEVAPKSVILNSPDSYLMTLLDKKEFLEKRGFDYLFVLPFDKEIAKLSAEDFMNTYLKNDYMKYFVCGYDFHFGHFGSGTPEMLQTICPTAIIDKYELSHHRVSTSIIKDALNDGDIENANKYLDRLYSIQGEVIHGKHRGKTQLGFPTANIDYSGYILPKNGVYATKVLHDGKLHQGMTNIGYNPTFGDIEHPSVEVHLFNFNEIIYGENIQVFFEKRIRNEMKFESLEELKQQLNKDQKECLNYFN